MYYSILADEATTEAMEEQTALILRFVDKNNISRRNFQVFLTVKMTLQMQDYTKKLINC